MKNLKRQNARLEVISEVKKIGGDAMGSRIVIPVIDESGLNAQVAEHFGRAPYFAVVELDESGNVSNVKTVPNVGEHAGGMGQSHDHIVKLKPNAIIVYGMGPRGLSAFQEAGIAVLKADTNTLAGNIAAYNEDKLQELTEGCHEAHHQEGHDAHHHAHHE
jgi:predicted Fe-Mo cluster-binding NifX family protein